MSIELQPQLDNTWITLVNNRNYSHYVSIPVAEVPRVIELLRSWLQDQDAQAQDAEGVDACPI